MEREIGEQKFTISKSEDGRVLQESQAESLSQRAAVLLDLFVSNYFDKSGELKNLADVLSDEEVYKKYAKIVGEEVIEDTPYHDEIIKLIVKKLLSNQAKLSRENIALVTLASDLIQINFDGGREKKMDEVYDIFQKLTSQGEVNYLLAQYAKMTSENTEDHYVSADMNGMKEERFDKKLLDQWHEGEYDNINFLINDSDVVPLHLENDEVDGEYTSGNYVAAKLSPEVLGFYSLKGDLVAFKKISEIDNNETGAVATNNLDELNKDILADVGDDLAMFRIMESLPLRGELNKELGFDIGDLSLRIQNQFLQYISHHSVAEFAKVKQFIFSSPDQSGRIDRVKSFLSLEGDPKFDEKLLKFGENLGEDLAQQIFSKYSEIVDVAERVEEYLRSTFGAEKNYHGKSIRSISEQMLRSGKDLLVKNSNQISNGKAVAAEEILKQLSDIKADILLFGRAFKEIRPDLEEINGAEFNKVSWSSLTDIEKKEMWEIAQKNWSPRGHAGAEVLASFRKILDDEAIGGNNDFYLYKKDGKLVSFIRFYPDEKDFGDGREHVHAHSFNVSPDLRGSNIGKAMSTKMLLGEAQKGKVVHGSVYPEVEMGSQYVEEVGFNLAGVHHDAPGKKFEFDMICDLDSNQLFSSKQMKIENLKNLATSIDQTIEFSAQDKEIIVFKINPISDAAKLEEVSRVLFVNNYVGTRYWIDTIDKSQRYFVFEKNKLTSLIEPIKKVA